MDNQDVSLKEVIDMLIAVARAAEFLADNVCDDVELGVFTTEESYMNDLDIALDALDGLPEIASNIHGTGPAKAEGLLNKFLKELE